MLGFLSWRVICQRFLKLQHWVSIQCLWGKCVIGIFDGFKAQNATASPVLQSWATAENLSIVNFLSQKSHANLVKLYSTKFWYCLLTTVVEQFPDHIWILRKLITPLINAFPHKSSLEAPILSSKRHNSVKGLSWCFKHNWSERRTWTLLSKRSLEGSLDLPKKRSKMTCIALKAGRIKIH